MHLLGLSGSLRASSTNSRLLQATLRLAPPGTTWTIYDGLADIPAFSPDLDGADEQVPPPVRRLRELLRAADAVVVCTPEYAHGLPGALKNLLDWHVGSGELVNKPVAAISAGPGETGGGRAHTSLLTTLAAMNAALPPGAALIVPFIRERLSAQGDRADSITDPTLAQELRGVLAALHSALQAR